MGIEQWKDPTTDIERNFRGGTGRFRGKEGPWMKNDM